MTTAADPDLDYLQHHYGEHWRIWRTPNWWVASARDATTTHEPTLIEDTAEQLERRMKKPAPRIGGWGTEC